MNENNHADPGGELAPDAPPWNQPGLAASPEFRQRIAWVENLARNRPCTDKSWVEPSDRKFLACYRGAVLVGKPVEIRWNRSSS